MCDNPSSGQSEPPLVDSQRISSSGQSRKCGGGQRPAEPWWEIGMETEGPQQEGWSNSMYGGKDI